MELEGAEERRRGRTRVEEHERVVHEPIDFTSRLAPEDHPVGELEEVAAGGEAIEVLREATQRPEELAAEQEDQLGRRPMAEHRTEVKKGLEGAAESASRVLRSLGDPRDLAVFLGDQRDDPVRLAVGTGAEDEGRGADLSLHARSGTRSVPPAIGGRNLDKPSFDS